MTATDDERKAKAAERARQYRQQKKEAATLPCSTPDAPGALTVYTNTKFSEQYPITLTAVVVADCRDEAERLLNAELRRLNFDETAKAQDFEPIDTSRSRAIVLAEGFMEL